jgi:hypothetical protein
MKCAVHDIFLLFNEPSTVIMHALNWQRSNGDIAAHYQTHIFNMEYTTRWGYFWDISAHMIPEGGVKVSYNRD